MDFAYKPLSAACNDHIPIIKNCPLVNFTSITITYVCGSGFRLVFYDEPENNVRKKKIWNKNFRVTKN